MIGSTFREIFNRLDVDLNRQDTNILKNAIIE